MKLVALVKLMIEQAPGYYARTLRVIGQDLADLFPENLAIEAQGDGFVVQGLCAKGRIGNGASTTTLASVSRLFGRVLAALARGPGGEPDLEFVPFSRTYSAGDIERLERKQTAQRTGGGMPDIYTLGERLRTIGKVVDSHNGRLVRIFKDLHRIAFEYQDTGGGSRAEELSNTELYQLQQRYAAERGASGVHDSAKA